MNHAPGNSGWARLRPGASWSEHCRFLRYAALFFVDPKQQRRENSYEAPTATGFLVDRLRKSLKLSHDPIITRDPQMEVPEVAAAT